MKLYLKPFPKFLSIYTLILNITFALFIGSQLAQGQQGSNPSSSNSPGSGTGKDGDFNGFLGVRTRTITKIINPGDGSGRVLWKIYKEFLSQTVLERLQLTSISPPKPCILRSLTPFIHGQFFGVGIDFKNCTFEEDGSIVSVTGVFDNLESPTVKVPGIITLKEVSLESYRRSILENSKEESCSISHETLEKRDFYGVLLTSFNEEAQDNELDKGQDQSQGKPTDDLGSSPHRRHSLGENSLLHNPLLLDVLDDYMQLHLFYEPRAFHWGLDSAQKCLESILAGESEKDVQEFCPVECHENIVHSEL